MLGAMECECFMTQVGYYDVLQSGRDTNDDHQHADHGPFLKVHAEILWLCKLIVAAVQVGGFR